MCSASMLSNNAVVNTTSSSLLRNTSNCISFVRYLAYLSPAKRNHRELDAIESYSLVCGAFIACTELDYDVVLIQVQLWIALV